MTELAGSLLSFAVFDATDDAFFIKDRRGVFCYCNDAFAALLAKPKDKILNATAFDLAPLALAKIYVEADLQVFASRTSIRYFAPIVIADGSSQKAVFNTTLLSDLKGDTFAYLAHVKLQDSTVASPNANNRSMDLVGVLTPRENQILTLIGQGNSGKKIASNLNLSIHTVTTHIKSIYAKLNVHSSTEALHKANVLSESNQRAGHAADHLKLTEIVKN
jgi:hypothetical protein